MKSRLTKLCDKLGVKFIEDAWVHWSETEYDCEIRSGEMWTKRSPDRELLPANGRRVLEFIKEVEGRMCGTGIEQWDVRSKSYYQWLEDKETV